MSEQRLIDATAEPMTRPRLVADLRALGVESGMVLLVHASLGRIGWVAGGAVTVIEALEEALGPEGTLVMPTFTEDLADPSEWSDPPVPGDWLETLRAHLPLFDPAKTPTRTMGRIAELFRTWPGVRRSDHPVTSLVASGPLAEDIVAQHALAFSLGDGTPMARLYHHDARVLLLGVDHTSNSSLHLAESRARHGRRKTIRFPILEKGARVWRDYPEVIDDNGRLFPEIGRDFETAGLATIGPVGGAESRLMPQRALVDFAAAWLDQRLQPRAHDGVREGGDDEV